MSTFRVFQLVASVFLILNTGYLYLRQSDWWIYGLLSGSAAVLNIINRASCPYWRFLVSVVIVLGTLETLFLTWSLRLLEQTSTFENKSETFRNFPEGKNLLLVIGATFLTISTRLKHSQHHGFIDYIRSLIIIALTIVVLSAGTYSTLYCIPALADAVTHLIEV